jgi:hypothetical protein
MREDRPGWVVLAAIPGMLATLEAASLAETRWRFSFCRYDASRTGATPVIASTSPHPVPAFHRPDEWGRLRLVTAAARS